MEYREDFLNVAVKGKSVRAIRVRFSDGSLNVSKIKNIVNSKWVVADEKLLSILFELVSQYPIGNQPLSGRKAKAPVRNDFLEDLMMELREGPCGG